LSDATVERGAPLRIAHLTATFPPYPGGAGNTAFRFATGQAERGHHVEIFTAPADGPPPDPGAAILHRIDPVFAIGNAPLIPSIAAISGFDVVHLHYPFIFGSELTLLARLTGRRRRQALLVHYKNRLVAKGPRRAAFETYEHTVAPLLVRAADRICVLSADHAGSVPYLQRIAERDPARLVEMPNGVDTELFAPGSDEAGVRAELGIPDEAVVAAFVATLDRAHHFKRVDVAIDAITTLRGDVHLLVAGGGELLEDFRRRAARAGVADRVHFMGAVPHTGLPNVLRASDLLLLTTEPPESFGIVLIEAMACGLPTIATEYPGVRAVVDEGETGLLVPAGDPRAVTAAIERLVEAGPQGRAAMGAAGRAKAERLWSWPSLLDRMDAAYAEAIAERRGRTA
jgi:glycosyltransferase involved in cell wall biosynthesis